MNEEKKKKEFEFRDGYSANVIRTFTCISPDQLEFAVEHWTKHFDTLDNPLEVRAVACIIRIIQELKELQKIEVKVGYCKENSDPTMIHSETPMLSPMFIAMMQAKQEGTGH